MDGDPDRRRAPAGLGHGAFALNADSLSTARRIRQPIEGRHDVETAFDTITYYKGKAVLEMVEAWLGEGVFRRGVARYMGRHAWGNARAEDFFEALSEAAGKDVAPAVSTFIDQNGAPLITARRACGEEPHLALEQEPYRPLGSAPSDEKSWQVPVCAAFPKGHGRGTGCTLLAETTGELVLGAGRDCPEWALANAGVRGYYRLAVTAEDARRLLGGAHLTVAERLGLAGDLAALVANGDLAAGDVLELVPLLANDAHPRVVGAAVDLMDDPREALRLARGLSLGRDTRRLLWELLEENWDAVAGRLSPGALAYLPYFARPECEAARKRELEAWLAPRVKDLDGGPRRLEQALEQIDQCVARRAAQRESAVEFLERELGGSGDSG